ncbi:MAG: PIN domain-containing protein [Candidatus Bathyarchaeia archaeon]
MKSKKAGLRVLLDTSFILPSLGIDVGEEVLEGLKRIDNANAEIHYSCFSILESLWVAVRLLTNAGFDAENFKLGLRSIINGDRYSEVKENYETFYEAFKLYMLGHRDMIDNMLYASSIHLNLKLLTLDRELKEFVQQKKLRDTLIFPDQITA